MVCTLYDITIIIIYDKTWRSSDAVIIWIIMYNVIIAAILGIVKLTLLWYFILLTIVSACTQYGNTQWSSN